MMNLGITLLKNEVPVDELINILNGNIRFPFRWKAVLIDGKLDFLIQEMPKLEKGYQYLKVVDGGQLEWSSI